MKDAAPHPSSTRSGPVRRSSVSRSAIGRATMADIDRPGPSLRPVHRPQWAAQPSFVTALPGEKSPWRLLPGSPIVVQRRGAGRLVSLCGVVPRPDCRARSRGCHRFPFHFGTSYEPSF